MDWRQEICGYDSTNHSVVLTTPSEGVGMKPSELLLVALASLHRMDVVGILEKQRIVLGALKISAEADRKRIPPWTLPQNSPDLQAKGRRFDSELTAITLSEEKYCSVAATVRGVAEITTSFEIL